VLIIREGLVAPFPATSRVDIRSCGYTKKEIRLCVASFGLKQI
jgi:hypothetical protein